MAHALSGTNGRYLIYEIVEGERYLIYTRLKMQGDSTSKGAGARRLKKSWVMIPSHSISLKVKHAMTP